MNMDQEFESVYQKIYDASYARLADVKDKNRKFLAIFGLALAIVNLIVYLIPGTRAISVCLLIFFLIIGNQSYTNAYKKCVIEGLIKAYDDALNFDPAIGISEIE